MSVEEAHKLIVALRVALDAARPALIENSGLMKPTIYQGFLKTDALYEFFGQIYGRTPSLLGNRAGNVLGRIIDDARSGEDGDPIRVLCGVCGRWIHQTLSCSQTGRRHSKGDLMIEVRSLKDQSSRILTSDKKTVGLAVKGDLTILLQHL